MSDTATVDELRTKAKEELKDRSIRLADELDKMIKLFVMAREALENEMFSGLGYKKEGIGEKDVKKLKDLTLGLNSVVEVKIKYDKAAKQLAATMTPAEERDAVVAYLKACDLAERKLIRDRLAISGIFPWKECAHGDIG